MISVHLEINDKTGLTFVVYNEAAEDGIFGIKLTFKEFMEKISTDGLSYRVSLNTIVKCEELTGEPTPPIVIDPFA